MHNYKITIVLINVIFFDAEVAGKKQRKSSDDGNIASKKSKNDDLIASTG